MLNETMRINLTPIDQTELILCDLQGLAKNVQTRRMFPHFVLFNYYVESISMKFNLSVDPAVL